MFLSETVTAEEAACWGTGMLRWLMLRGFEWKYAQAVCKHGMVYRSRFCFQLLSNSESLSFLFGFCYDFMKINVHTIIPIICNHF